MVDTRNSYVKIADEVSADLSDFEKLKQELPPCKNEDGINCFWDASVQGNGKGTSFVAQQTDEGVKVIYEDGTVNVFD